MKLFLVHYRHSGSAPCKSITQLPFEKAAVIAQQLYAQSQCRAHRRFGPAFPGYYEYRLKLEQWLHDSFVSLGGKPEIEHPYYFVLQSSDMLRGCFDDCIETRIDLERIAEEHICFTFGDSMAQQEQNSFNVFSKSDLLTLLANYGNDIERFISAVNQKYNFIEAQLWADSYF